MRPANLRSPSAPANQRPSTATPNQCLFADERYYFAKALLLQSLSHRFPLRVPPLPRSSWPLAHVTLSLAQPRADLYGALATPSSSRARAVSERPTATPDAWVGWQPPSHARIHTYGEAPPPVPTRSDLLLVRGLAAVCSFHDSRASPWPLFCIRATPSPLSPARPRPPYDPFCVSHQRFRAP